jgi:MFS family permease
MAGITAAQALGAPLAAGLLSLHGTAGLSGWRWLFIIEGIPSIVMGVVIFVLLPREAAHCKWLTAEERECLQETIDAQHAEEQLPAVASGKQLAGSLQDGSASSRSMPSMRQIRTGFTAALKNKIVWCASFWRFLYVLTLNSLIYFTPLIVNALASQHGHAAASPHSSPKIMLLTAVPYCAGVAAHLLNAYHSKKANERRYHIAISWLWGGIVMCMMPIAWIHSAPHAAFALLVLSCVGVMGCDGIDISFIMGLLKGLHPSQRVLGMAWMNTLANVGGFTGAYLLGFLKGVTGEYYAGCWLMGGAVLLAAACVAAVPQEWGAVAGASDSSSSSKGCSSSGSSSSSSGTDKQQPEVPVDGAVPARLAIGRRASIVVPACAKPLVVVQH